MTSLKKPDKERLIAALTGEIPDRVPNWEVAIEAEVVKEILGRDAGSTLAGSRGASDEVYFQPPMNPFDYIEICKKVGQDVIGFEALWTPLKYEDENGDIHIVTDGRITSFDELDKVIKPNWEMDYKPRKKYFDEYKEATAETNIGFFIVTGAIFQCSYQFLCEFNQFLTMMHSNLEFVEALMDECVKYYQKIIELAIDAGATFICIGDDIAFKSGTFISPEMLKEVWLPRINKLIKPIKEAGIPVMFHSCGNITDIMDDIIMDMNIDCLNPIEPYSNDIFKFKEKYGDEITLSGNIDIAGPLAFGSEEEVKEEVKEHLERLMPGGRYILSTNHSIMNDIPYENYMAMLEVLFDHGIY